MFLFNVDTTSRQDEQLFEIQQAGSATVASTSIGMLLLSFKFFLLVVYVFLRFSLDFYITFVMYKSFCKM